MDTHCLHRPDDTIGVMSGSVLTYSSRLEETFERPGQSQWGIIYITVTTYQWWRVQIKNMGQLLERRKMCYLPGMPVLRVLSTMRQNADYRAESTADPPLFVELRNEFT